MKNDITSKADIKTFVDAFYAKMPSDDLVGKVFMEVMQVDFSTHLPKMYDFWEMLLFQGTSYQGAPMRPHLQINQIHPITPAHFERWLGMFRETVRDLFEGPKAEEAITKAENIASTWAYKLDYLTKHAGE
jgi:hemoglobin